MNLWNPNPAPGVFSSSQQWWTAGSGGGLQTVESGWHVFPQFYNNDRATLLFIFFTMNGYQTAANGWPTGSAYNLSQVPGLGGFVQTDNMWVMGGSFATSQPGGDQQGFLMAWRLDTATGNWWLYLQAGGNAVPVGYYPGTIFRNGPLTRGATRIDFGGEMCSQNNGRQTGHMGSGQPASAGWQYAAYQGKIAYAPAGGGDLTPATLIADQQDAPAYTIDLHNNQGGQTYFNLGGPGAHKSADGIALACGRSVFGHAFIRRQPQLGVTAGWAPGGRTRAWLVFLDRVKFGELGWFRGPLRSHTRLTLSPEAVDHFTGRRRVAADELLAAVMHECQLTGITNFRR
jgi:hypothetical protein